ncbi:hypothetical protein CLOM_g13322 [Closterium sp. NIES-68]|nr:hypothetical protein CLOM_g8994 [Closterium sp. NIES-68]GJP54224.1 hypothetical protein CLOM_g13322 [Closterium sp. NIES-68]GJP83960.1 hypothetical protein CLOP_g14059 [Closterium sp. NIES-67]
MMTPTPCAVHAWLHRARLFLPLTLCLSPSASLTAPVDFRENKSIPRPSSGALPQLPAQNRGAWEHGAPRGPWGRELARRAAVTAPVAIAGEQFR